MAKIDYSKVDVYQALADLDDRVTKLEQYNEDNVCAAPDCSLPYVFTLHGIRYCGKHTIEVGAG